VCVPAHDSCCVHLAQAGVGIVGIDVNEGGISAPTVSLPIGDRQLRPGRDIAYQRQVSKRISVRSNAAKKNGGRT